MITLDMDLYPMGLKLEYISDKYKDKWLLLPGAFHTSLCAIRCLGKTIKHSGLDESWVISGLHSQVTVNQIINGSHYNRAVTAHVITSQCLICGSNPSFTKIQHAINSSLDRVTDAFKLSDDTNKQGAILKAIRDLLVNIESMHLLKQLIDFDKRKETPPIYTYLRVHMRQVLSLLNFHRAVKSANLSLYLASLENLAAYFCAYNRLDYAQNILEFFAKAFSARETHPDIW